MYAQSTLDRANDWPINRQPLDTHRVWPVPHEHAGALQAAQALGVIGQTTSEEPRDPDDGTTPWSDHDLAAIAAAIAPAAHELADLHGHTTSPRDSFHGGEDDHAESAIHHSDAGSGMEPPHGDPPTRRDEGGFPDHLSGNVSGNVGASIPPDIEPPRARRRARSGVVSAAARLIMLFGVGLLLTGFIRGWDVDHAGRDRRHTGRRA